MFKIKSYKELNVWKLGKELVLDIYRLTKDFPKEEMFGIISQMRKAAISIPSNIAEGFNRHHTGDYKRFLYFSLGSCAELETQIEICQELGYIQSANIVALLDKLDHESKMLRILTQKL